MSENVVVSPKEDATLSCTADGNPLQDDSFTWKRDDIPNFATRTSVTYDKNGTSFLRITGVTREELGSFKCIVDNGVGNSSTRDVMLIVKRKLIVTCIHVFISAKFETVMLKTNFKCLCANSLIC